MKIKGIDYSREQILTIFESCSSFKEVLSYFEYKQNGSGQRLMKKLRELLSIDSNYYRKEKEKNTKCLTCGKDIAKGKFCSCSCAARYNNILRGKHSTETKQKISKTILLKTHDEEYVRKRLEEIKQESSIKCLNCGKEIKKGKYCSLNCMQEFIYKKKVNEWLNGKNSLRGETQPPNFIRKYLFQLHDSKCEKCGWCKTNPITGLVPLQIHHKDGDCTNNLLDNLELLCPNCHSLTETFGNLNHNSKRFFRRKKTK